MFGTKKDKERIKELESKIYHLDNDIYYAKSSLCQRDMLVEKLRSEVNELSAALEEKNDDESIQAFDFENPNISPLWIERVESPDGWMTSIGYMVVATHNILEFQMYTTIKVHNEMVDQFLTVTLNRGE